MLGERWGFLLALVAAVPFTYTAITLFIWDRDLGFRENTPGYWIVTWGMWRLFAVVEAIYCFVRLLD